jgi:hypothetical protein
MGTIVECPSCHRPLHVATDLLGYPLNCPACATTFEVAESAGSKATETRALEEIAPGDEEAGDEEDRPWDQKEHRRVRRDCEPHRGRTVLILGIVGLGVSMMGWLGVFGLPLGISAWVMGQGDLRKIRNGEMDPGGHSLTRAGRICGIISTVWSSCVLLLVVAWFTFVLTFAVTAKAARKVAPVQTGTPAAMPVDGEGDDK